MFERGTEQVGLVAAQLEQQRPTLSQELGRLRDDAPQEVEAVRTAVVVGGILEGQGVPGEQVQLGGGDVGHHRDDHVGRAPERRRHSGKEVTHEDLDPIRRGTGHRSAVAVGRYDPGSRSRRLEGDGHRTRPGAQVDGVAVVGQAGAGPPGQLHALPTGDVDPGVDDDRPVAEGGLPGDPGQGLAGQASVDQRLRRLLVATRTRDDLTRFLFGGETAAPGQLSRQIGQEAIGLCGQSIMAPAMGVVPGPAPSTPSNSHSGRARSNPAMAKGPA